MSLKESILKLYNEGKSRKEICEILKCASSTVAYHLTPSVKEKAYNLTKKNRKENWIYRFMYHVSNFKNRRVRSKHKVQMCQDWNKKFRTAVSEFRNRYKDKGNKIEYYSYKEALEHLGGPICECYLTGQKIDITKDDYQLDHIIPVSKGGDNSLKNMGITIPIANQAKTDLTLKEYLDLCKQVLEYNGYIVTKK